MSVKCEDPSDELTVQVWLLSLHPNLKYWTLFVSGTEVRTDGQTDRQTDGRTDDPITILVKTSNRTLYKHKYNGVKGFQFQCLVALEPINQKF